MPDVYHSPSAGPVHVALVSYPTPESSMGLRSLLKRVTDKFSGEYSAAQADIRPDEAPTGAGGDVQVTRARLKRPKDAKEESAEKAPRSGT